MPLLLAIAGLTSSEQAAFVAALRDKANLLSCPWTLFSDSKRFPEKPDALFYCPQREEGRRFRDQFKDSSTLCIAAIPAGHGAPSEVPLFARMPFQGQDVVETLNVAALRIRLSDPIDSPAAPKQSDEEKVELQFAFKNHQRVPSLALSLFAVFQTSSKSQFFKLRSLDAQGLVRREIWCWPDLELYWSALSDEETANDPDGHYEVFNCSGKKQALAEKQAELRPSSSLLWRSGFKAFKTAETLPWFSLDGKLSLSRWPFIPKDARSEQLLRILTRLTQSEATFLELLNELRISRRDLCSTVNALVLSGCLQKTREASRAVPAKPLWDPESDLFLKALSLKCAKSLADALDDVDSTDSIDSMGHTLGRFEDPSEKSRERVDTKESGAESLPFRPSVIASHAEFLVPKSSHPSKETSGDDQSISRNPGGATLANPTPPNRPMVRPSVSSTAKDFAGPDHLRGIDLGVMNELSSALDHSSQKT